jgi:hypothetical protein
MFIVKKFLNIFDLFIYFGILVFILISSTFQSIFGCICATFTSFVKILGHSNCFSLLATNAFKINLYSVVKSASFVPIINFSFNGLIFKRAIFETGSSESTCWSTCCRSWDLEICYSRFCT